VLVFVIAVIFWWSVRSGQFDDLEGPGYRVVSDDDDPPRRGQRPEGARLDKFASRRVRRLRGASASASAATASFSLWTFLIQVKFCAAGLRHNPFQVEDVKRASASWGWWPKAEVSLLGLGCAMRTLFCPSLPGRSFSSASPFPLRHSYIP
jgi:cbb3-type cytochrome oxidase maturation protein